jgi:NADH:ubiquinone oxidoreductase subunit 2 (subunit N)
MKKADIRKISDLINKKISEKYLVIFIINVLSMSGLPPFIGFFVKFIVLYSVFSNIYFVLLSIILVFFSFLAIYFYLKVGFSVFVLNQKKVFKKKTVLLNTNLLIFFIIMNLVLPVAVYLA